MNPDYESLLAQTRARIDAGFYDAPEVIDATVDRLHADVFKATNCPGDSPEPKHADAGAPYPPQCAICGGAIMASDATQGSGDGLSHLECVR